MSQSQPVDGGAVATKDNPILQGNFAPVEVETTARHLVVEGVIPKDLNGALLCDGPNPIAPGPDHRWFAGDGMVHGISIRDGRAQDYPNRWVRTAPPVDLFRLPVRVPFGFHGNWISAA